MKIYFIVQKEKLTKSKLASKRVTKELVREKQVTDFMIKLIICK